MFAILLKPTDWEKWLWNNFHLDIDSKIYKETTSNTLH